MEENRKGIWPGQMIRSLMRVGRIRNGNEQRIGGAAFDLTLSTEAYRVNAAMLPQHGQPIGELLKVLRAEPLPEGPLHLVPNVTYFVRLEEWLHLYPNVYGLANARSTVGRLDMHVRVVAEGIPRFNQVPAGYTGNLWAVLKTQTFSIDLPPKASLTQLRLIDADTRLSASETRIEIDLQKLLWSRETRTPYESDDLKISDNDGSIIFTLDTESDIIGWKASRHAPTVDFAAAGTLPAEEYFAPIERRRDGIVRLERNHFHVLSTRERLRLPPHLAANMQPMDPSSGEIQVHYAGFAGPTWGVAGEGIGRSLTLEVRPHEHIWLGQRRPIAKIVLERMHSIPEFPLLYDSRPSTFLRQTGATLAPQFKI